MLCTGEWGLVGWLISQHLHWGTWTQTSSGAPTPRRSWGGPVRGSTIWRSSGGSTWRGSRWPFRYQTFRDAQRLRPSFYSRALALINADSWRSHVSCNCENMCAVMILHKNMCNNNLSSKGYTSKWTPQVWLSWLGSQICHRSGFVWYLGVIWLFLFIHISILYLIFCAEEDSSASTVLR